jgi:hypothetical protein
MKKKISLSAKQLVNPTIEEFLLFYKSNKNQKHVGSLKKNLEKIKERAGHRQESFSHQDIQELKAK